MLIADVIKKQYSEETVKTRERVLTTIKNLMESLNLTLEQALSAIKVSDADRAVLIKRF